MSTLTDYAEKAVIERTEDDTEDNDDVRARVSFGSFILRVAVRSDN